LYVLQAGGGVAGQASLLFVVNEAVLTAGFAFPFVARAESLL
jgi:hypothetical protein